MNDGANIDAYGSQSSLVEPKEEPMDDFLFMPAEKEITQSNFIVEKVCKEEEDIDDDVVSPRIFLLREPVPFDVDTFDYDPHPITIHSPDSISNVQRHELKEQEDAMVEREGGRTVHSSIPNSKDSSETVEVNKRGRLARNAPKPLRYTDSMEVSGRYKEPSKKKSRSEATKRIDNDSCQAGEVKKKIRFSKDLSKHQYYYESNEESDRDEEIFEKNSKSEKKGAKKRKSSSKEATLSDSANEKPRVYKESSTELKCLQCEYCTHSVHSWEMHLKRSHSTNPKLAGVVLRCECGHECTSSKHSIECDTPNFTVIHKRHPKCVLCEMHPTTAYGYTTHLKRHHKSTLKAIEIYLLCACGFKITYFNSNVLAEHKKKCAGRLFTLHKLSEA